MRKLVPATVLALLLSVVPLGHQARAAVLVVDDLVVQCPTAAFTSINAAIAAASPGDTIQVCPGLYNEMVNINKDNLTLLGAQANVDARTRPSVPDPLTQSIIEHPCGPVQITANNAVLNGFTVQGSVLPDPCFLAGIWMNPGFSGTNGGSRILYDIVQDNISGIELDSTCAASPTVVQFNLIQNNVQAGPGAGNGIQTNFGLCNATIDSNTFSGDTNSSILMFSSSNISVTNNTLASGFQEGLVFGAVNNLAITDNVSISSTRSSTIRLFGDTTVNIDRNTLLTGMSAIRLSDGNTGVTGHMNCIQGNAVAGLELFAGGHVGTLDATMNWWGSPTGPTSPSNPTGTGDKVIDPDGVVDFIPFLTSPPGPPCPVPPPPPNTPGKVTGGGYINGTTGGGSTGGTTGGIGGIVPVDPVMQLAEVLILQSSNPASKNTKATFGFTITCCDPKGNLEYNDHGANVRIKATSMTNLVITDTSPACPTGKHAQFKGQANETTSSGTTSVMFTVDVDDCGEPGSSPGAGPDTFKISTTSGYMAGGLLVGGNIQIHRS